MYTLKNYISISIEEIMLPKKNKLKPLQISITNDSKWMFF